jgi:LmbE family N-acetylglucosaminyl deacetylase
MSLSKVASLATLGWSDRPAVRLAFRRSISRAARLMLRLRSSDLHRDVASPVLVLAPHPDDETFGCGGTLAMMAQSGAEVHIAFLTDGSASHTHHTVVTPAELAARRVSEARVATGILGVDWSRVEFLGAPDGHLARLDSESRTRLVSRMSGLLSRLAPATILLPCRNDGSSEHNAAFQLVWHALGQTDARPRILEFPVWSLWNPRLALGLAFKYRRIWRVNLLGAREKKALAAGSYTSQTDPIPPDRNPSLPRGFAAMFLGRTEFLFEQ